MRPDFHVFFAGLFMLFGVLQLGMAISLAQMQRANEVALSGALLFITALGVLLGYRSLIRAVDRGYSSAKSSLAAVFLLLGASPALYWSWNIVNMISSKN